MKEETTMNRELKFSLEKANIEGNKVVKAGNIKYEVTEWHYFESIGSIIYIDENKNQVTVTLRGRYVNDFVDHYSDLIILEPIKEEVFYTSDYHLFDSIASVKNSHNYVSVAKLYKITFNGGNLSISPL